MVYESDFYTTRRPYRPSSYTTTTPRHYVVLDQPERPRRADEQYSYSYSSTNESRRSDDPYTRPVRSNYSNTSESRTSSAGGPGNSYNYSTERSSTTGGGGPGGYHASYSSTTSGRLPHGTNYRHYSYRV